MLPKIAGDYHVNSATTGWMVAFFSAAYVLSAPLMGLWADRHSRRNLIFTGLLGFSIANLLTAFSINFLMLLFSRFVAGLTAAAVTPSIYAMIEEVAPQNKKGSWLAIVGSGLLMALWFGVPLGTILSEHYGWVSIFMLLAACSVCLSWLNRITWPAGPITKQSKTKLINRPGIGRSLYAVIPTMIWGASVYGFYTYLGTGLQMIGYHPFRIALTISCYGIGAVIGSLTGGRLSDSFGSKKISLSSLGLLAVILAIIGWGIDVPLLLQFLLILFALSGYAFFPAFQHFLLQKYPQYQSTFMAWNNSALYIGITCGSAAGGYILKNFGFTNLPFVMAGLAFAGALFAGIQHYGSVAEKKSTSV